MWVRGVCGVCVCGGECGVWVCVEGERVEVSDVCVCVRGFVTVGEECVCVWGG